MVASFLVMLSGAHVTGHLDNLYSNTHERHGTRGWRHDALGHCTFVSAVPLAVPVHYCHTVFVQLATALSGVAACTCARLSLHWLMCQLQLHPFNAALQGFCKRP
jgi:hypothetical protein